jgi:membrane protease YdiL (CAAX protease family)
MQGLDPVFEFFVGGFSLTGDTVKNMGTVFVAMCILFNLINVVMEEGVFRGLFLNLCNEKYTFAISNLIVAFLFGIWHFVTPLRSYMDGQMDFNNMIGMGIGYIILAGLMSIKWGVLRKMSGVLWIGLGEHFFNNTVQNLLHITTTTGVDELQIARIIFAQLLTFIVVMVVYRKHYCRGI